MKWAASAGNLFQNVGSHCDPEKGLWIGVMVVDLVSDGGDELFEVMEDAAPYLPQTKRAAQVNPTSARNL